MDRIIFLYSAKKKNSLIFEYNFKSQLTLIVFHLNYCYNLLFFYIFVATNCLKSFIT